MLAMPGCSGADEHLEQHLIDSNITGPSYDLNNAPCDHDLLTLFARPFNGAVFDLSRHPSQSEPPSP